MGSRTIPSRRPRSQPGDVSNPPAPEFAECFAIRGALRPDDAYGDVAIAVGQAPEQPIKASAPEQPNRRCICNESNLHDSAGALLTAMVGAIGETVGGGARPHRALGHVRCGTTSVCCAIVLHNPDRHHPGWALPKKNPPIWRAFVEAAEETRTLDLLHGKQTL